MGWWAFSSCSNDDCMIPVDPNTDEPSHSQKAFDYCIPMAYNECGALGLWGIITMALNLGKIVRIKHLKKALSVKQELLDDDLEDEDIEDANERRKEIGLEEAQIKEAISNHGQIKRSREVQPGLFWSTKARDIPQKWKSRSKKKAKDDNQEKQEI
jgi:hypothetical protein